MAALLEAISLCEPGLYVGCVEEVIAIGDQMKPP